MTDSCIKKGKEKEKKKKEKRTQSQQTKETKKGNKKHKLKLLSTGEITTYEGIKYGAKIVQKILSQNLPTTESI